MVLMDGNRIVDNRPCIGIYSNSLDGHAYMVNSDYTLERVRYADHDMGQYYFVPKVDADDETIRMVRAKNVVGKSGAWAQVGDTVIVTKGRKYPKGLEIKVARTYIYKAPDYSEIHYIEGAEGERISAYNTEIIGVGESTHYLIVG